MTTETVEVSETFTSIQGESTYAGLPCFFIRLAGCNLSCSYCDTPQARVPGKPVQWTQLVRECIESDTAIAEITGGEPLLQPLFPDLASSLRERTRRPVLVETNGSRDISIIPDRVTAIMDIKTPGSGMSQAMDMANIERLRPHDEVKFVLLDRADYEWARQITRTQRLWDLCRAVLFSPAHGRLDPATLAGWIVDDRLPVRLNLQLHKILGVR